MTLQEWPAHDYAIGSFIQANIANNYLLYLKINPTDSVLDIGCGNGIFSRNILEKIPHGNFLGIDASENILALAKQEIAYHQNANVQKANDEINMINELLVNMYQQECQEKFAGKYWFNLSLYLIQCEK